MVVIKENCYLTVKILPFLHFKRSRREVRLVFGLISGIWAPQTLKINGQLMKIGHKIASVLFWGVHGVIIKCQKTDFI